MLDKFESWIQENRQELERIGYKVDIFKSPSHIDQPLLRLDLDGDDYIARIVLWDCGECQLGIIHVLSESMILDENLKINNTNPDFSKIFKNFIDKLK